MNLTARQHATLETMRRNNGITIQQLLACELPVNERTMVKRDIASMREQGVVSRTGADKNGKWVVAKRTSGWGVLYPTSEMLRNPKRRTLENTQRIRVAAPKFFIFNFYRYLYGKPIRP